MSEALTLKVGKPQFQETLSRLAKVLSDLEGNREQLQNVLDRMDGANFSGSDVKQTVKVTKEALARVEKAIVKVTAQREIIERALEGTESASQQLASTTNDIENELPDIFA